MTAGNRALSVYFVSFVAIAIFFLFVRWRTDSFLLSLVVKALFVGFLAAAVYSLF